MPVKEMRCFGGIYDWTVEETGWQRFDLPEPVDVVPGKFYLVHISTSVSVEPESSIRFSAVQVIYPTEIQDFQVLLHMATAQGSIMQGDGTAYPGLGTLCGFLCGCCF